MRETDIEIERETEETILTIHPSKSNNFDNTEWNIHDPSISIIHHILGSSQQPAATYYNRTNCQLHFSIESISIATVHHFYFLEDNIKQYPPIESIRGI